MHCRRDSRCCEEIENEDKNEDEKNGVIIVFDSLQSGIEPASDSANTGCGQIAGEKERKLEQKRLGSVYDAAHRFNDVLSKLYHDFDDLDLDM